MSSQGKLLQKYHKPDHMKTQPMHHMQMKLKLSMAFACQTTYVEQTLSCCSIINAIPNQHYSKALVRTK